jgi:hypothetical protein
MDRKERKREPLPGTQVFPTKKQLHTGGLNQVHWLRSTTRTLRGNVIGVFNAALSSEIDDHRDT